ncbi:hypothetical protein DFH09DRAFT_919796 [Mycena vulgaris]|nr:hypothetical protein DFH09DRAFT_919796 [Mycena vulgaris]
MEEAPPPPYPSRDAPPDASSSAASALRPALDATPPEAPPTYTFPKSFTVGGRYTAAPFVNTHQLKDHLVLLHAFAELKNEVEGLGDGQIRHMPADKARRWTWFVGLAVERFETWCKALKPSQLEKGLQTILPPIDVFMVWHAYLLNPGWYAEDVERVVELRGLKKAGDVLAASLGENLGTLIVSEPSAARVAQWVKLTATPFDPFEAASLSQYRVITCPKCSATVHASFMTDTGTGYLQHSFMTPCPNTECQFQITHDALALRKLALDLSTHRPRSEPQGFLAPLTNCIHSSGTLHTPINPVDLARGWTTRAAMLNHHKLKRPDYKEPGVLLENLAYADFIMQQANYDFGTLKNMLAANMRGNGGRLIGRITSAYTDDKLFSVELILRQGTFVAKMHELQWTRPGFFDTLEDETALRHAIARYHAFLDLMSSSPASFFVPTLDIDLAWHTHQLMASNYSNDTRQYVGRFIDHDDKVAESQLASSFDITCRAWKERYGVQYMHCGCPLPGDTIGQKLSRLIGAHATQNKTPYLVSPMHAATHPSDHNAVFALRRMRAGEIAQRERRAKIAQREQRDGTISVHDPAFLTPVPLYEAASLSLNAPGCAATTGSVISAACAVVRASGRILCKYAE